MATARDQLNAYVTHQTDADKAKFNALLDDLCAEALREAATHIREARRMGHLLLVSEEEIVDQLADEAGKGGSAEPIPAADQVVAYRNADRPSVLLCLKHGHGRSGMNPMTSQDLPDGGICTWRDCGADVLAVADGWTAATEG